MQNFDLATALIAIVAIVIVLGVFVRFAMRARRLNLTRMDSPGQKPDWMRTTPLPEPMAATRVDGDSITLYDHNPGQEVAAPFAEQIENIARALIQADPELAGV